MNSKPWFFALRCCSRSRRATAQCPHGSLTGNATYVRDGDTIELGSMAIRFWGIAAPEWDAPSGQETTNAIKDMVLGKQVRRELTGKKTYDRCVGVCYLKGRNIEEELVRIGLARDCPRFSGGRSRQIEQAAADQGAAIRKTYRLPRGDADRRPDEGAEAQPSQTWIP